MPKKKKKKVKKKTATKRSPKKRPPLSKASHLRQSKTEDFINRLKQNNSMVDYFTRLSILNPAAKLVSPGETRREGSFVRLAHAREEFTAPVLTKGKAVIAAQKEALARRKKQESEE